MYLIVLYIPFILGIISSLKGRFIGYKGVQILLQIFMPLACIIGLIIGYEIIINKIIIKIELLNWVEINDIRINMSLEYNRNSIYMVNLILIISTIVLYYSIWYMKEDPHQIRFNIYLFFFTFFMLILILSNNLLFSFVGWEFIGIFSYFLINFWFTRIQANKSALKAMYYNRIGDCFYLLGSVSYISEYNISLIKNLNTFNINFITLCFIIAAIAKSAQLFFHPWLASSMEGPTPVSALLHAATMVTAGVYILIKIKDLYVLSSDQIKEILLYYSILTIIFSGLCSLFNYDIKKIIAFSTSAQLAYMFIGYNIEIESLYHLLTHGFFKALLFILAGIIIHSFLDNQDIRRYGSLIFFLPKIYSFFLIGTLTITTLPYLSSFYSKEIIIENLFLFNFNFYFFSICGAFLTLFYSLKLFFFIFFSSLNSSFSFYPYLSFNSYNFYYLLILVFGSIFLGYIIKNEFLVHTADLDFEFIPFYIKLIPFGLGYLLFVLFKNTILDNFRSKNLVTYISSQFFLDSLLHNTLVKFYSYLSYNIYFKVIERGFLEFITSFGTYKYLNLGSATINNTSQSRLSTNFYNYILFFFFFFFSLLFITQ